jgi:hypothetical protein
MHLSPRRLTRHKDARPDSDLQHWAHTIIQMRFAQGTGARFNGEYLKLVGLWHCWRNLYKT